MSCRRWEPSRLFWGTMGTNQSDLIRVPRLLWVGSMVYMPTWDHNIGGHVPYPYMDLTNSLIRLIVGTVGLRSFGFRPPLLAGR